jgi:cytochrome c553
MKKLSLKFLIVSIIFILVSCTYSWKPLEVKNDHLVRMPGSQPPPEGSIALESPDKCMECHSDYDTSIEPGYNWKGSMMAQAARDFLFWACLTVAAQDSIWATGRPNATDICLRCHFPEGWIEGRSDPTNASLMTSSDYDGVHCDFCHNMFDPFFEKTYKGIREGMDWFNYWDETNKSRTPSRPKAETTYHEDRILIPSILFFNGKNFYGSDKSPNNFNYSENSGGQFFLSGSIYKRASFADARARHPMLYSRYHKSKYFCSTCHDVSNPALANLNADPNKLLPTELNSAYSYFHVERTFSEFMLSDYSVQGGASGIGPFAPSVFETSNANNYITKCQDCHMKDKTGKGCNLKDAIIRPEGSIEHPESGQPLHDLIGGNIWVLYILASAIPGSANYDLLNDQKLHQGPNFVTLDLTQGQAINPVALLEGVDRAKKQLQIAASIQNANYNASTGSLSFRIQNQTGHKLISGFPEGRRMFLNIKAYDKNKDLIYEVNPYDTDAKTLKGLHYNYQPDPLGIIKMPSVLNDKEIHLDELVYEMHQTSSLTDEKETLHFVLATGRYKDNRIPPKGFRIKEAPSRLSEPVWHGVSAYDYFTEAEYTGGFDEVSLFIVPGASYVEINLYYQTTSREYIEFLRDEINGTGNITLSSPAPSGKQATYIVQTDPFFTKLKAWGDTIWQIWTHNVDIPGAAPFLMTQMTIKTDPK